MKNKDLQSKYDIASVSWGKDSLAMLLLLIDKGYPLDEVVFYDTGMEFQAIYNTQDKMLPVLESLGIKFDKELNSKMTHGEFGKFSAEDSKVALWVVPTNEELLIARDTLEAISK